MRYSTHNMSFAGNLLRGYFLGTFRRGAFEHWETASTDESKHSAHKLLKGLQMVTVGVEFEGDRLHAPMLQHYLSTLVQELELRVEERGLLRLRA